MRTLIALASALLFAAPLSAQHMDMDPDNGHAMPGGGVFPAGWQARVDHGAPANQVVFQAAGSGFHATMGPAAVFYNPAWKESGDYQVSARFTQNKAPTHPEAYGIVIGGSDLGGADQQYSYFEVRGTGEYYIANRKGDTVTKIVPWTANPAIQKQNADGVAANVLGVQVKGNDVLFTVNGTQVASVPKSQLQTDGTFALRNNHHLHVNVDQVKR
jgi:hypothetical protein